MGKLNAQSIFDMLYDNLFIFDGKKILFKTDENRLRMYVIDLFYYRSFFYAYIFKNGCSARSGKMMELFMDENHSQVGLLVCQPIFNSIREKIKWMKNDSKSFTTIRI